MREIFIYYKISPADEAGAMTIVLEAHQRLMRTWPGLVARLLKRSDMDEGHIHRTWMETYSMSDDAGSSGVDAIIERDIERACEPLQPLLQGRRHVEVFIACA